MKKHMVYIPFWIGYDGNFVWFMNDDIDMGYTSEKKAVEITKARSLNSDLYTGVLELDY